MTVGELLEVVSEYTSVKIINSVSGETISGYDSTYNGKDSISPTLNSFHVWQISVEDDCLYISI